MQEAGDGPSQWGDGEAMRHPMTCLEEEALCRLSRQTSSPVGFYSWKYLERLNCFPPRGAAPTLPTRVPKLTSIIATHPGGPPQVLPPHCWLAAGNHFKFKTLMSVDARSHTAVAMFRRNVVRHPTRVRFMCLKGSRTLTGVPKHCGDRMVCIFVTLGTELCKSGADFLPDSKIKVSGRSEVRLGNQTP